MTRIIQTQYLKYVINEILYSYIILKPLPAIAISNISKSNEFEKVQHIEVIRQLDTNGRKESLIIDSMELRQHSAKLE